MNKIHTIRWVHVGGNVYYVSLNKFSGTRLNSISFNKLTRTYTLCTNRITSVYLSQRTFFEALKNVLDMEPRSYL